MERNIRLFFRDRKGWRDWLAANHSAQKEAWLVFYKKHTGKPTISYDEAVEEAICFGWIDGIIKRVDADRCARKFTPRSRESRWSALNIKRARKMIESGRMTASGLARFRGAKSEPPPSARFGLELPPELMAAIQANPAAQEYFLRLPPSERRLYVGWILSAKKEETRKRRLAEAVGRLAKGEKLGMK